MKEYELRILNINKKEVIKRLEKKGAKLVHPEVLQKRYIFDFPNSRLRKLNAWIRLREIDRKKVELTFKKRGLKEDEEITLFLDNFEKAKLFLERVGLVAESYQENKRIRYKYNDIIFDIDTWPLINPYLEIESTSRKKNLDGVKLLGFNKRDAVSLAGEELFSYYGINLRKIKELKFQK